MQQKVHGKASCEGITTAKGIDFNEIFSAVVKLITIKSMLSIMEGENLYLEHQDVNTAFLYGDSEEDIYMLQP